MTPWSAAEIVVVPLPELVARPKLLITVTPTFDELQLTNALMFCAVPSLNVPVELNCWDLPSATEAFVGKTLM